MEREVWKSLIRSGDGDSTAKRREHTASPSGDAFSGPEEPQSSIQASLPCTASDFQEKWQSLPYIYDPFTPNRKRSIGQVMAGEDSTRKIHRTGAVVRALIYHIKL
jgi:hypothetical protein